MLRLIAFLLGLGVGIGGAFVGTAFAEPGDPSEKIENYNKKKAELEKLTAEKQKILAEAQEKLRKAQSGIKYNEKKIIDADEQIDKLEDDIDKAQEAYYDAANKVKIALKRGEVADVADSNAKLESWKKVQKDLEAQKKSLEVYRSNLQMHRTNAYKYGQEIKGTLLNVPYYGVGSVPRVGGLENEVSKTKKSIEELDLAFQSQVTQLKADVLLTNLKAQRIRLNNDEKQVNDLIKKYDDLLDIDNTYMGNYVQRKISASVNQEKICELAGKCGFASAKKIEEVSKTYKQSDAILKKDIEEDVESKFKEINEVLNTLKNSTAN